ncbi:MAG: DUF4296 domain-containing protein [Muribaculum sp.]|nr:DUF4296 domain-containing protein [Muribaculum sp.]
MKSFLLSFFTFMAVSILPSCSDRPKEVMSDKEMIDLLVDMNLADAYRDNGLGSLSDSVRTNMGEAVLARHGFTYAQLDTTLRWYGRHLDKYYEMLGKVDRRMIAKQKNIDRKSGSASTPDNSNQGENIWSLSDHFLFSSLGNTNGLHFDIPGDEVEKGESLKWTFRVHNMGVIKAYLGVEYTDGASSYTSGGNNGEQHVNISLLTDTSRTVKRVIGNIYTDPARMPVWIDSIQIVRLPFDSVKYASHHYQRIYSK